MQNVNETLLGGREISVQNIDGTSRTIKVLKVSHLKGDKLVGAYGNDVEMAKLCTGLEESELEKITEDSFYDIIDVANELNEKTVERALKSQAKKLSNPAYQAIFQQASTLISSPGA